jgi:hypothetical protein
MSTNNPFELVEAYQAVYNPQDISEEEIWEEVDNFVNSLLEEGYDLSEYTWEDMYEAYVREARDGYGDDTKFKQDTDKDTFRPGKDVPKVKKFGRISRTTPYGIGDHANKTQSRVSTIVGKDTGAPRSQKMPTSTKMVKGKDGKWKKVTVQAEELDAYDIILMHLLDEGYASHPDAAESIMANMSEDWIGSIIG